MSVRQEKFSGLIQQHLADIFMRNPEFVNKEFVTISKVEVSPDLGYAKVYLSMIKVKDRNYLLNLIVLQAPQIRKHLAAKIRNQARIVPELNFLIDDSLDYVFKIDELMKRVNAEDERKRNENKS
ncbi:MAG: 30S ribosome-binding factor RbfA [Sphingobacteriales bacterium]|jgi:ribosome-binding factor A|nr:30S ribosome-binding factor RbfA [Sphingobacteriales bacterium]